ncbi:MAG: hypothetical protein ACLTGI_12940 [Hoylesella buccalis]
MRVSPCAIPPTIVAIDRETPGIMAMHWNSPTRKALFSVSGVDSLPWLNKRSQNNAKHRNHQHHRNHHDASQHLFNQMVS